MKFIRQLFFVLFVATVLGSLGGIAYFTHHPDAPVLERAEAWPVLGPLAERFRAAYLGSPEEGTEDDGEATVEYVLVDENGEEITGPINLTGRPVHPDFEREQRTARPAPPPPVERRASRQQGKRASPPARPAETDSVPEQRTPLVRLGREVETATATTGGGRAIRPSRRARVAPPPAEPTWKAKRWHWFLPEHPVRRQPRAGDQAFTHLRTLSHLPVLADLDGWVEVVYEGERAWVESAWQPPYRRRKSRRGILRHQAEPVRTSDFATLREARKFFGTKKPARSLGPYQLFTDVEDEDLLAFLDQAASMAEEAYFARFGRLPSGDPLRTAVLFAKESDYRAFGASADIPLSTRSGHAGVGILAFFAEGQTKESLATTLVHEIGHLLNDRSLAYRLPQWLEEGLAEELGALWLEQAPAAKRRRSGRPYIDGYSARLARLASLVEEGRLPTVPSLLNLDRDRFYADGVSSVAYAMSAVFIRFLLEGENGRYADGFRTFLERIAVGTGADLLKQLDSDPATLDRGLRGFILEEMAALERRYPGIQFR